MPSNTMEDSWVEMDRESLILQPHFCLSEMNRHHYALYVHNCRLVFLLRKDFDQADTFRPAEFHWKLDQVRLSGHAFSSFAETTSLLSG